MIQIVRAPVHLAVQDLGYSGQRKTGLPRAGAMDPLALQYGNSLVGNSLADPGLEWAVTGGAIRFTAPVRIALTGANVRGRLGHERLQTQTMIDVSAGTTLEVDRFVAGRFAYLCLSPPPLITAVFGSRSTYLPGRIGGFEGRRLRNGDLIPLSSANLASAPPPFTKPDYSSAPIRLVPGPQSDVLGGRLLSYLLQTEFRISANSDRTGYRLEGPSLLTSGLGQILSEPACEGAIQVTDAGTPIVLMADGPTIGGYNKVGVVAAADLPRLAQKSTGETVRFALKTTSELIKTSNGRCGFN